MAYSLIKTLHIMAAIWLVVGIFGRQFSRFQARRSPTMDKFIGFNTRAGKFERIMVIPGNMAVLAFGITLGLMGGWPILGFLQGSNSNWLLISNFLLVGVMLLVPLVYLPKGRIFDASLKRAVAQDRITADLHQAMDDSVVNWAHRAEYLGLFLVILLMVFKPF